MLVMDAPDHTRVRGLVNKAFTPRRVTALRPRIQAIADELLAEPTRAQRMELMTDLAAPLPAIVIAELLGVPAERPPEVPRLGRGHRLGRERDRLGRGRGARRARVRRAARVSARDHRRAPRASRATT